ncbi:hypothetical protein [Lichenicoccus sp.]|uniref:hypothetical protein n=1 Tax=Lichenicoccus sp. TaxID=2781899 RepID=UPI003D0EF85F
MNEAGRHADTPLPPFPLEYLALPDEDLAAAYWWWWVAAQAEAVGISRNDITPEFEEAIRRKTWRAETENITNAGIEKILHLLARNDFARSGAMIRKHQLDRDAQKAALDEVTKSRNRQSDNGRKPRLNSLNSLILEHVSQCPALSIDELLDRLRKLEAEGSDIIDEIDDAKRTLWWRNKMGPAVEITFTALSQRLSRVRKIVRSR